MNEVFMGIMAGVWLPDIQKKNRTKVHPVNFLFKFLLVFLFITTVCGSSFNTVFPVMETIQAEQNKKKIINILQSQVEDNRNSLKTFSNQNQRANSAISVRNQIKTKDELKTMLSQQKLIFNLWLEVFIIVFIRFGVQLANLSCIWLAGWIYRQPTKTENLDLSNHKIDCLKQQTTVYNRNRYVTHDLERTTEIKTTQKPTKKIVHENNLKKTVSVNEKKDPLTKKSSLSHLKTPTVGKKLTTVTQVENQQQISAIRKKIYKLLQSRNDGISLSDISKAIGERESNLVEIVNPKARFKSENIPILENILFKIEKLYQAEHTRWM